MFNSPKFFLMKPSQTAKAHSRHTAQRFTPKKKRNWFCNTCIATTKSKGTEFWNSISRATHNMYAYRIFDEKRGVWIEENDDDGESAAGSRMALLVTVCVEIKSS